MLSMRETVVLAKPVMFLAPNRKPPNADHKDPMALVKTVKDLILGRTTRYISLGGSLCVLGVAAFVSL